MLNKELRDSIYTVAEKINKGEKLTVDEQDMYDDILEDVEAYRVFCLFTVMLDMPEIMASEISGKSNFYRDREDIEKHIAGTEKNAYRIFSK